MSRRQVSRICLWVAIAVTAWAGLFLIVSSVATSDRWAMVHRAERARAVAQAKAGDQFECRAEIAESSPVGYEIICYPTR